MNAVIDHHRSSHQRAKTAPIAGTPGWDIARALQTKLINPNCKPGMTVVQEVPKGTEKFAFDRAVKFVRENLNILIDKVEETAPTADRGGFIKARRASKVREGVLA